MNNKINLSFIFYLLLILTLFGSILGVAIVNTTSIIIFLVSLIIIFLDKKILLFYQDKYLFFIYFFLLTLIISSIYSYDIIVSLEEIIPFLFYLPYIVFFLYLINLNINLFFRIFYITLLLTYLVLFLYLIYQIILIGEPILYYNYLSLFQNKVLGNFVIKFFPLLIGLTLYYFYFSNDKKFILIFITILFISLFMIVASGQRTSFYKFFIICLSFIFLINNKKIIIFLFSLIISTIISFNFLSNNSIYERFYLQTLNQFKSDKQLVIFSPQHNAHFETSLKMFSDKPLFGIGPSIFKYQCVNQKYITYFKQSYSNGKYNIFNGCSTHPHNYYLELMSENGIFAFLLFVFFYSFLFYKFFNKKKHFDLIHKTSIISLVVIYFPFAPSLSFFNSWSNAFNFIILSIFIYFNLSVNKN